MSEQFIYDEKRGRNDFYNWAFVALTTTLPEEEAKKFFSEYDEKQAAEVEVKINGKEVSFKHIIDRIGEAYNEEVKLQGKLLLNRYLDDFKQQLSEISENLVSKIFEDAKQAEEKK